MTLTLERSFAEELVNQILGYSGGDLLQMHTCVRIDVRLMCRWWRLRAAAALECQLRKRNKKKTFIVCAKVETTRVSRYATHIWKLWLIDIRCFAFISKWNYYFVCVNSLLECMRSARVHIVPNFALFSANTLILLAVLKFDISVKINGIQWKVKKVGDYS